MRGSSYLGLTGAISWLLMPWLLTSPGHQNHAIDYVEYVGPGLTWGRILSTSVISMLSNDMKCKHVFMFPLQNVARKELICMLINGSHDQPVLQSNVNVVNYQIFCLDQLQQFQQVLRYQSQTFNFPPCAGGLIVNHFFCKKQSGILRICH